MGGAALDFSGLKILVAQRVKRKPVEIGSLPEKWEIYDILP